MPEIKNLKKAAGRIKIAIQNKENVVLYGDADMDGVTSVIILRESIKNLGGKVSAVYFPDRESEGYGLSETGLNYLRNHSPALLVVMDCGIGNFKEAELAKKMGFELIVIDHHEILDKLPKAKIIVDPKQKGDMYPFKGFSAAGLVFKLAEELMGEKMSETVKRNFLELTALSTTADMMPKIEENKRFIEEGFLSLEDSLRPGIRGFLKNEELKDLPNFNQKISKMISILNIRDVADKMPASFRLLTAHTQGEAELLVADLMEKSKIRRETIERIVREVEERLAKKSDPVIFEGEEFFELTLISSSASIICNRHKKPTFIFKRMPQESHGTVRTPSGVNGVELMKKCSKYLLTYGGHPQAAGFRLKNENLDKFKECLIKNLKQ